jgi:hypothetical protein
MSFPKKKAGVCEIHPNLSTFKLVRECEMVSTVEQIVALLSPFGLYRSNHPSGANTSHPQQKGASKMSKFESDIPEKPLEEYTDEEIKLMFLELFFWVAENRPDWLEEAIERKKAQLLENELLKHKRGIKEHK